MWLYRCRIFFIIFSLSLSLTHFGLLHIFEIIVVIRIQIFAYGKKNSKYIWVYAYTIKRAQKKKAKQSEE